MSHEPLDSSSLEWSPFNRFDLPYPKFNDGNSDLYLKEKKSLNEMFYHISKIDHIMKNKGFEYFDENNVDIIADNIKNMVNPIDGDAPISIKEMKDLSMKYFKLKDMIANVADDMRLHNLRMYNEDNYLKKEIAKERKRKREEDEEERRKCDKYAL